MIGFKERNNFEILVMDLMEQYRDHLKKAEDVEKFADELHQSVEIAIGDMLAGGGFNNIDPDDYDAQY